MAKVLIIDDDKKMCKMLNNLVQRMGHEANEMYNLKDGLVEAQRLPYDAVLLDVQLPDGSGLDIIPQIKAIETNPEVIIMTGYGNTSGAEMAIKNGAWDYIQKTDSPKKILLPLQRVIQYREDIKKVQKPVKALVLEGIIGTGDMIRNCFDKVAQAAMSDASVLITGETGTGKELFARAVHNNSARSAQNYVIIDCAALPETLIESTLFGHAKGAFTGADKPSEGLLKQADGGTLLLDEIGEMPINIQKAFLRVLQERRFRPVGTHHEVTSNFRLIASTNRNLDEMVKAGAFRKDLLFRLRTFMLELPPLRERKEDIKAICAYHLDKRCEQSKEPTKGMSQEFLDALHGYDWPGNVRELINTLDYVVSISKYEPTLYAKHLPDQIRIARVSRQEFKIGGLSSEPATTFDPGQGFPKLKELREKTIYNLEKKYLADLVAHVDSTREACRISGIGKTRFYELIKKYGIDLKD